MVAQHTRRIAAGLFAAAIAFVLAAPAVAAQPPNAPINSTDGLLKWINDYRNRPEPESLPAVVHALSAMQAFKDAETCGAYIGFIAGVLGANPSRAESLIGKMLAIDPADHWVLVRAIAYSGLPHWRELLSTFADRMPMRRAMVEKYLDGELPTLEQIDYAPKKPGMMDKVRVALQLTDQYAKKPVTLAPSPELIDVLWGLYLATGTYAPIGRIVKLLPLSNDHDSVDNLTTGSAAKFTLASNAVRDLNLLNMLKWSAKHQPKVSPWCSTTSSKPRRPSIPSTCARNRSPPSTSSSRKARTPSASSPAGARSAKARCRWAASSPRRPADRIRHTLRTRRRRLFGGDAVRVALGHVFINRNR